jgi:hypothetical protein
MEKVKKRFSAFIYKGYTKSFPQEIVDLGNLFLIDHQK